MYYVYLDKVLLPIAPESLKIKINGRNETMILVNDGEINQLKMPGLTDIDFEIMLPMLQGYPFATYLDGFKYPSYYLDKFEELTTNLKPFQFIVSRMTMNGKKLFNTDIKVSLENYSISEKGKSGLDIYVSISLKQYKDYGTKSIEIEEKEEMNIAVPVVNRPTITNTTLTATTYTVKNGDSLYDIAKKFYGKGSQYTKIYDANKDEIKNPSLIYPGQVLTIP